MWAYRLAAYAANLFACFSVEDALSRLRVAPANTGVMSDEEVFTQDYAEARKLARRIDWNGTVSGTPKVFMIPGASGMLYGFLIREATGGRIFVMSPIELPHLDVHVSWDGNTDSNENDRTIAAMKGEAFVEPTKLGMPQVDEWRRSKSGNMWTLMDGARVVVLPENKAGKAQFKAIIYGADGQKLWSPTYPTEKDCMDHTAVNFYKLTAAWRSTKGVKIAKAFDAADWGSDDADEDGDDIPF